MFQWQKETPQDQMNYLAFKEIQNTLDILFCFVFVFSGSVCSCQRKCEGCHETDVQL